jgi:apolipoprotein D and lipocalin family protein
VINRCRKPDGKTTQATGRAKIVDRISGAKLKVSFFGPFYGDYWVMDHAEDYSWSIVGEPSGRYLWLLARTANPAPAEREALIARAKALGYDTAMLRITQQP